MKKWKLSVVCLLAFAMIVTLLPAANAVDGKVTRVVTMEDLGDGFTVESEIVIYETRATSTKSATKQDTYKYSGDTIAVVSLTATFGYNGSSAWMNSKSVTHETYDNWSYSNESLTSSGGTATVTAKLRSGIKIVAVDTTLSCSATGVLS